jgi:Mg/Co/Ni transporter MgtE
MDTKKNKKKTLNQKIADTTREHYKEMANELLSDMRIKSQEAAKKLRNFSEEKKKEFLNSLDPETRNKLLKGTEFGKELFSEISIKTKEVFNETTDKGKKIIDIIDPEFRTKVKSKKEETKAKLKAWFKKWK